MTDHSYDISQPAELPAEAAAARSDLTAQPARTARTRQVGLAAALFVAPWLIAVANAGDSITTMHGGDDTTPQGALALAAAHPTLDRWSSFAALLGSLLLVPASLGLMRLVRLGAARVGLVGGAMMVAAYVCYFALVFQGFTPVAMVSTGGSGADHAAVLQALLDEPLTLWVYLVFAIGNIVGTFLMGLALRRSRAVPAWAAYAIMAWPVLHIVGLPWFEAVGAVVQALGMAGAGAVLLGRASPRVPAPPEPYELLRR
jgi:hypothetical protein